MAAYRKYFLYDPINPNGGVEVEMPEDSCVFCEHCTDLFWDYTNGIYMVFCEEEKQGIFGGCESFKEGENE